MTYIPLGCKEAKGHAKSILSATLTRMNTHKLILASGSPRRKELLERAGYSFEIIVSDVEENAPEDIAPAEIAERNARLKARAVAKDVDETAIVIGADTVVSIDGVVFGKPSDEHEAKDMLGRLSGRTHQVITGVCLASGSTAKSFHVTTDVTFRELAQAEIDAYVACGEPMDKAGAYGIQGAGGKLVDHISGDYDNVVGLPVSALAQELQTEYGITNV